MPEFRLMAGYALTLAGDDDWEAPEDSRDGYDSDDAAPVGAYTEKRQGRDAVWAVCSEPVGENEVRFAGEVALTVYPNFPLEIAPLDPARRGEVQWPSFYGIVAEPGNAEARAWVKGQAWLAVAALPYSRGWVEVSRFRSHFKGQSAQWDQIVDDARHNTTPLRVWFQDRVRRNPFERRKVRTCILLNPRPTNRYLFSGRTAVGGEKDLRSNPKLCWGISKNYPEQRSRLQRNAKIGAVLRLAWAEDSDRGAFFNVLFNWHPQLGRRCDHPHLHASLLRRPQPGEPDLLTVMLDECIDIALAGPEERYDEYRARAGNDLSVERYLLEVFSDCLFMANRRLWEREKPEMRRDPVRVVDVEERRGGLLQQALQQLAELSEEDFDQAVEAALDDLEFGDFEASEKVEATEIGPDDLTTGTTAEVKSAHLPEEVLDLFVAVAAILRSGRCRDEDRGRLCAILKELRDNIHEAPIVRELAGWALDS